MKCSNCNVTIYDYSFKKCPVCGKKIKYPGDSIIDFKLLKSVVILPLLITNLFIIPLLLAYVIIYVLRSNMEAINLILFTMHYFLLLLGIILISIVLVNFLNNSNKKTMNNTMMTIGVILVSVFLMI